MDSSDLLPALWMCVHMGDLCSYFLYVDLLHMSKPSVWPMLPAGILLLLPVLSPSRR